MRACRQRDIMFINIIYFKNTVDQISGSACLFVLSCTFCFCGLQTHGSFVSLSWLQVCVYASARVYVYALLSSNMSCMFGRFVPLKKNILPKINQPNGTFTPKAAKSGFAAASKRFCRRVKAVLPPRQSGETSLPPRFCLLSCERLAARSRSGVWRSGGIEERVGCLCTR